MDRGRRLGGRLAARTREEHPIDLGGPYCTVSDDRFRAVADEWLGRGLLREWTDTFRVAGPDGLGEAKQGPMRFAAPGGMRSLVEDLATGHRRDRAGRAADRPRPRGRRRARARRASSCSRCRGRRRSASSSRGASRARAGRDAALRPGITVVARFAERTWPELDAAFVSDLPIRWLADDGRSHGDGAPVLVAHSTPEVAAAAPRRSRKPSIAPALDAMRQVLGVPLEPVDAFAHRWTFAQPAEPNDRTFLLDPSGIALCGDGWSERSKVEAAWRSGDDLGAAIADRLG